MPSGSNRPRVAMPFFSPRIAAVITGAAIRGNSAVRMAAATASGSASSRALASCMAFTPESSSRRSAGTGCFTASTSDGTPRSCGNSSPIRTSTRPVRASSLMRPSAGSARRRRSARHPAPPGSRAAARPSPPARPRAPARLREPATAPPVLRAADGADAHRRAFNACSRFGSGSSPGSMPVRSSSVLLTTSSSDTLDIKDMTIWNGWPWRPRSAAFRSRRQPCRCRRSRGRRGRPGRRREWRPSRA